MTSKKPAAPATFYKGEDYDVRDSVGYLLHAVTVSMRREIESRLAQHGMTFAQWAPLWKIKNRPACTAQHIVCEIGVDAGAVTRMLDRLVAKGLVERTRSETDRRVVNLELTEAGEAAVARIPDVMADVNNGYLQGFDAAEWKQLRVLLARLLDNGRALDATACTGALAATPAPRDPTEAGETDPSVPENDPAPRAPKRRAAQS